MKRELGQLLVRDWDIEAIPEVTEFVIVELLLLVSNIHTFTRGTQAVTFDCLCQYDSRRSVMIDRSLINGVDFSRVVSSYAKFPQIIFRVSVYHGRQARISAEDPFVGVERAFEIELLVFSIHEVGQVRFTKRPSSSFAKSGSHSLPQMTFRVFHPTPRKTVSSSWIIFPFPRTGPSSL